MTQSNYCPHVQGSFVRRRFIDGTTRVGEVVDRRPNLNGWVLHVRFADGSSAPWPCDSTVQSAEPPDGAMLIGAQGPDVVALQEALNAAGFPPGLIDGNFGFGTQAAVRAFQLSKDFSATGIADSATQQSILQNLAPGPDAWPRFTVQVVASMFPSATPMGNIKAHLPTIARAMQARGLVSRRMVLMALSTIRAETESFQPISEYISRWNTSPNGSPFDLYDHRTDIGNQGPPDGAQFKGRGFVQLTGRDNYQRIGGVLNIDLIGNPEQANDPQIAADILAYFIKSREQQIEQALIHDDLRLARRLVNGGSHGLDRFVAAYRAGETRVPA